MAQDAQLISQAGQVESLASDGLVSVSTGAGQPQKNMELAKFADSLGSSVPLQQTSEQVNITGLYARTSDGKMVELTKESVASVMAGLVVSFPKHGAIDDANLDDIKTVGTYTVGDRCTNKPASETWNHSMLQVVVGRNDWVTQIYYSGAYGKIYIRHFKYNAISTGEWSSWSTINFGYNSLAELSSGVAEQMGFSACEMKGVNITNIIYVLPIPTQFKGEVVGKYLLKDASGNVSETNFIASVHPNGSFNLNFDGGINPGSYVLVMCGGNK